MKPLRKATVMFKNAKAGVIEETGSGYRFTYDPVYLGDGKPIAVALPARAIR
jgi:HipA-like protein